MSDDIRIDYAYDYKYPKVTFCGPMPTLKKVWFDKAVQPQPDNGYITFRRVQGYALVHDTLPGVAWAVSHATKPDGTQRSNQWLAFHIDTGVQALIGKYHTRQLMVRRLLTWIPHKFPTREAYDSYISMKIAAKAEETLRLLP